MPAAQIAEACFAADPSGLLNARRDQTLWVYLSFVTSTQLTHICELVAMYFNNRLFTIERFCRNSHDRFRPILEDFAKDVIAARNDFVHHGGYREFATRFFDGNGETVLTSGEESEISAGLQELSTFFEAECKAIGKRIGQK